MKINALFLLVVFLFSFGSIASPNPYLVVCEGDNMLFSLRKESKRLYLERSSHGDYVRTLDYEIMTTRGLKKGQQELQIKSLEET